MHSNSSPTRECNNLKKGLLNLPGESFWHYPGECTDPLDVKNHPKLGIFLDSSGDMVIGARDKNNPQTKVICIYLVCKRYIYCELGSDYIYVYINTYHLTHPSRFSKPREKNPIPKTTTENFQQVPSCKDRSSWDLLRCQVCHNPMYRNYHFEARGHVPRASHFFQWQEYAGNRQVRNGEKNPQLLI